MSEQIDDGPDWGYCDVRDCQRVATWNVEGGYQVCDRHMRLPRGEMTHE